MTPKLCKFCVHYQEHKEVDTYQGKITKVTDLCDLKITEPVHGRYRMPECSYARSNLYDALHNTMCGPDGYFWQARGL